MKQTHQFYLLLLLSLVATLYMCSLLLWLLQKINPSVGSALNNFIQGIATFGIFAFAAATYCHTRKVDQIEFDRLEIEKTKRTEKIDDLDKHIQALSELLKQATKKVLEQDFQEVDSKYSGQEAENERYNAVKAWTGEVNNYFSENDLVMYEVFFGCLHRVVPNSAENILNSKRLELKEIIKDLNSIKSKI